MITGRNRTIVVLAILLVAMFAMALNGGTAAAKIVPAPDFTATDHMNRTFSLSDYAGTVTIIHVTQLEIPLCIECERHMLDQMRELAALSEDNNPDVNIITLNVRKNLYSTDGWELARDWYGINVTWNWVEEKDYTIASLYLEYWDVKGNFANPSLIMIDPEQNVVGVYRIYTMTKGEVDGVQTAESLGQDVGEIMAGEWTVFRGETGTTTYVGVFILGILSTFSPCSLFMLFAIVSFIISSEQEDEGPNALKTDWKSGTWIGITFSLGMIITFAIFGALASYIGIFIESSTAFSLLVGIALALMGVNIIWPLGDLFKRFRRKDVDACGEDDSAKRLMARLKGRKPGLIGLILGILFTVGWTPCALAMVLPVLVMIRSGKVTLITGIALMCVFALGRAIVVTSFCAAIGGMKGQIYSKFIKAGKWIQPIFGIAMIALGVMYALRYWGFNLW